MRTTVGSLSYREFRSNKENFVGRMDIERERKRGEGVREPFPEEPYCSPVVLPLDVRNLTWQNSRWRNVKRYGVQHRN